MTNFKFISSGFFFYILKVNFFHWISILFDYLSTMTPLSGRNTAEAGVVSKTEQKTFKQQSTLTVYYINYAKA